jgi:integrase
VERIGTDKLQGYIASRREVIEDTETGKKSKPASNSTINRELAILKAMFRYGANEHKPPIISHVPPFPAKLNEPAPRNGFYTEEQYQALKANCRYTWLRAFLAAAYTFGFRKSELLNLKVHQIDLKEKTIRLLVGMTKNDDGRMVVMTDEVHGLVVECMKGKGPEDNVFTWADGRPVKDFRGQWNKLVKAAGLPKHLRLLHDFRRTAVKNFEDLGVSREVARSMTGHRTDSVYSRYNVVNRKRLASATEILNSRNSGRHISQDLVISETKVSTAGANR